jgi:competence ComEA-like helix-hairpin-helix protein
MNTSVFFALAFTCLATTGCDDEMPVAQQAETRSTTSKTQSSPTDPPSNAAAMASTDTQAATPSDERIDEPPTRSESEATRSVAAGDSEEDSSSNEDEETLQGEVNLNTASIDQLDMLPGVGPVTAGRIADYREKRRFQKPAHLKRVKGIGDVTFSKMKAHVTVDGETTIAMK